MIIKNFTWIISFIIVVFLFYVFQEEAKLACTIVFNQRLYFGFNTGIYGGMVALLWSSTLVCYLYIDRVDVFKRWAGMRSIHTRRCVTILTWVLYILIVGLLLKVMLELFGSLSRAAMLSAGVASVIVIGGFYGLGGKIKVFAKRNKLCFWSGLVGLTILLTAIGSWFYNVKEASANGRLLMWKMQLRTIVENPMGVGREFFAGSAAATQAEYFASAERSWREQEVAGTFEYGFNELLQLGVEQGVLAMVLFIALFTLAFVFLRKKRGVVALVAKGGLISFLVFSCFSYPLSVCQFTAMVIVLLIMVFPRWIGSIVRKIGVVVYWGGVLLFGLYYFLPFLGNQELYERWSNEQMYFNEQIFKGTVDEYAKLYPELKHEGEFLFEYGQCLSKMERHEESIVILTEGVRRSGDPMLYNIIGKGYQELGELEKAEQAYWSAYYRVPHRFYPLYLLAKLYAEQGNIEAFEDVKIRLFSMPEKISSDAIEDMKREIEVLAVTLNVKKQ